MKEVISRKALDAAIHASKEKPQIVFVGMAPNKSSVIYWVVMAGNLFYFTKRSVSYDARRRAIVVILQCSMCRSSALKYITFWTIKIIFLFSCKSALKFAFDGQKYEQTDPKFWRPESYELIDTCNQHMLVVPKDKIAAPSLKQAKSTLSCNKGTD